MKCLILGYYGAKNLGDDMMLRALIIWLGQQSRTVTVISEDPSDTSKRFGVKSVANTPLFLQWGWVGTVLKGHGVKLLKEIIKADEILIGGGDLIRDTKGWRTFFYTIEKLIFALLFRKPTYMASVGISKPTKKYSKILLKFLLPKCKLIIVRDKRSLNFCRKIGVKNVTLAADIATTLAKNTLTYENQINLPEKYCLITLRVAPNLYGQFDINDSHYKCFANTLDKFIEQTNSNVIFYPYQNTNIDNDNDIHKIVLSNMNKKRSALIYDWDSDLNNAFNLAANANLVIGMRLHALVVAVSVNTPCIAMPYDKKLDEFCELAGIQHFITPELMMKPDKLLQLLSQATEHKTNYSYLETTSWESIKLDSKFS